MRARPTQLALVVRWTRVAHRLRPLCERAPRAAASARRRTPVRRRTPARRSIRAAESGRRRPPRAARRAALTVAGDHHRHRPPRWLTTGHHQPGDERNSRNRTDRPISDRKQSAAPERSGAGIPYPRAGTPAFRRSAHPALHTREVAGSSPAVPIQPGCLRSSCRSSHATEVLRPRATYHGQISSGSPTKKTDNPCQREDPLVTSRRPSRLNPITSPLRGG